MGLNIVKIFEGLVFKKGVGLGNLGSGGNLVKRNGAQVCGSFELSVKVVGSPSPESGGWAAGGVAAGPF